MQMHVTKIVVLGFRVWGLGLRVKGRASHGIVRGSVLWRAFTNTDDQRVAKMYFLRLFLKSTLEPTSNPTKEAR